MSVNAVTGALAVGIVTITSRVFPTVGAVIDAVEVVPVDPVTLVEYGTVALMAILLLDHR